QFGVLQNQVGSAPKSCVRLHRAPSSARPSSGQGVISLYSYRNFVKEAGRSRFAPIGWPQSSKAADGGRKHGLGATYIIALQFWSCLGFGFDLRPERNANSALCDAPLRWPYRRAGGRAVFPGADNCCFDDASGIGRAFQQVIRNVVDVDLDPAGPRRGWVAC